MVKWRISLAGFFKNVLLSFNRMQFTSSSLTNGDGGGNSVIYGTADIGWMVAVVRDGLVDGPCSGEPIFWALVVNDTHQTGVKLRPLHGILRVTSRWRATQLAAFSSSAIAVLTFTALLLNCGNAVFGFKKGENSGISDILEIRRGSPYNVSFPQNPRQ